MRTNFLNDLSSDEITEILQSKPVVFIGSTISAFSPTNLLNGTAFCKNMYDHIFKNAYATKEYDWLRDAFEKMPFEALMECFPNPENLRSMIKNMFHEQSYNKLHECFAQGLIDGHLSAVITPNYDLAFDAFLKSKNFLDECIIRDEKDWEDFDRGKKKGVYFKIHGTSEDNYENTLIYTLSQERSLIKWKTELLKKLLHEKILIVVGYSGRDFDICPLIANLNEYKYRKIIWLQFCDKNAHADKLSAYSSYLLNKKPDDNEIILGNIVEFANQLFNVNISLEKATAGPSSFFNLSNTEQHKWQLRILSRMSCATLGLELLEDASENLEEEFKVDLRSAIYGHRGEYIDGAKLVKNFARHQNIASKEYIASLNSVSSLFLSSGGYIQSYYYLLKAKKIFKKFYPADSEIETNLVGRELSILMRFDQILNFKFFSFLIFPIFFRKRLAHRAEKLKRRAAELILSGSWDDRQGIQHSLERMRLDQGADLSLPAHEGYENLGLVGMGIIAYRDTIRHAKKISDQEQLNKLMHYIQLTKHLGMTTECWKLCRILVKRGTIDKKRKHAYWKEWKKNLAITQYHFPRKPLNKIDLYFTRLQF